VQARVDAQNEARALDASMALQAQTVETNHKQEEQSTEAWGIANEGTVWTNKNASARGATQSSFQPYFKVQNLDSVHNGVPVCCKLVSRSQL
jgi:hypothetical protein